MFKSGIEDRVNGVLYIFSEAFYNSEVLSKALHKPSEYDTSKLTVWE